MLQPKPLSVRPLNNYNLEIDFDSGETKIFDVKPYIIGEWFGKLKDLDMFNTVRVCGSSVEWADGQDIAPHELYNCSVSTDEPLQNKQNL